MDQILARVVNQRSQPQPDVPPTVPGPESYSIQKNHKDVIARGVISYNDAVKILNSFRETFMPCFPFFIIAPEVTVTQLRTEKPFLLLAILKASSYKDVATQRILEETFQRAVADQMIFAHTPSMDVLLGLLVALAW